MIVDGNKKIVKQRTKLLRSAPSFRFFVKPLNYDQELEKKYRARRELMARLWRAIEEVATSSFPDLFFAAVKISKGYRTTYFVGFIFENDGSLVKFH